MRFDDGRPPDPSALRIGCGWGCLFAACLVVALIWAWLHS
jgi:hypothetical protein